ncbi:MAG: glycosyltransferase family 39 protein [Fimbriiglobus sp.]|nr:glycosyltransferase family 39 protein [Fimbriiglobus sp.]
MSVFHRPAFHVAGVLVVLLAAHLLTARHSEPFFNNDETKHTLTGVFFADAIHDLPGCLTDPKGYAVRYYCQYPALGLVTWPPLFYLLEGLAMLIFGPHFLVGRLCVAVFAAAALVYVYRFARLMIGHAFALLAILWVGLTPLVFVFSQRVMLEVPTLAFVIAAVFHFEVYLTGSRRRDALLACLLAAAAVLTRFDGVILLPYYILRLLQTWNLRLLLRRPVLASASLALILTVPYYVITIVLYREGLTTSVTQGTGPTDTPFGPGHLIYYFATLPEQAGWPLVAAALGGLVLTMACFRRESGPAFGLMLAVYLTFSPLAELDWRHAIYWLPAVAVCAARPVDWLWGKGWRWMAVGLAVTVSATLMAGTLSLPFRYVFGYSDAMEWVATHKTTDRPILVDGDLAGSLVYHARRHDSARQIWVLRGDKVLYNQFSDPATGYRQYAHTEAEVLELLEKWDPEYVVVEDPQPNFRRVEGAELLQRTLRANAGVGMRFDVVNTIPLRTNYDRYTEPGATLIVYRKRYRNPASTNQIQIELIGLGRSIGAAR